jgi:hypothetical protein
MVFGDGRDMRILTQGLALIVIGLSGLIVIKLWYWIVHARLEILREVKRVELRLMQSQRPQTAGQHGAPPAGDK